jgi:alpha-ribazole phosphatase
LSQGTRFIWIRHAPTGIADRYIGRTDVPAQLPEPEALGPLWDALGPVDRVIASPMIRARQTAGALFPELRATVQPGLVEQDFGDWENRKYAEVSFPAGLDADELAAFTPPGGESFADVCSRVGACIDQLSNATEGETVAVVAHAGVIRAALVHALYASPASGIAFGVDHLSMSSVQHFTNGARVDYVNRVI